MSEEAEHPVVCVWSDIEHAPMMGQVLAGLQRPIRLAAVGGPRHASVQALTHGREQAAFVDDLRQLLVDHPTNWLLLGSMEEVRQEDIEQALSLGVHVISTEPVMAWLDERPDRASERPAAASGRERGRVTRVPALRRSPGWTSAADPQAVIGAPRLIAVQNCGGPGASSLFARLVDAWDLIVTLAGMPEQIDASLVGPLPEPPERLRGLTGTLVAHARIDANCSAVVQASDRSVVAYRQAMALGADGQLEVGDRGYTLYDGQGGVLDGAPFDEPAAGPLAVSRYASLIAREVDRVLDLADAPPEAGTEQIRRHESRVLACCHASLLSARTREAESPGRLQDVHRRGL